MNVRKQVRGVLRRQKRRARRLQARARQELRILRHRRRSRDVAISVVIPVYNALPYLTELLDSLRNQDMAPERFEVIAVDDGSTDGSGTVLDDYARRFPRLLVIHQPNSGWPGGPRNRGLDMAVGRYVFFADADDILGTSALQRMTEFSDEHDVDVLLPRMIGIGGRWVSGSLYRTTAVDADLFSVFRTLSPQKMFRTSMLRDHHIRFPEEKVRLEDGMMLAKAYLTASRVSVLADGEHYQIRERDDGQNISAGRLNPEGYSWSVGEVARIIRENAEPAVADPIVLDLYRRKCLKFYEPSRWRRTSQKNRPRWLAAHHKVIETHIPPELEAHLEYPFRQRSELVRAQDASGLDRWADIEEALRTSAAFAAARVTDDDIEIDVRVTGGAKNSAAPADETDAADVAESDPGEPDVESGPGDVCSDETVTRQAAPVVEYTLVMTSRNLKHRIEVPLAVPSEVPASIGRDSLWRAHVPAVELTAHGPQPWDAWVEPHAEGVTAAPVRVSVNRREVDRGQVELGPLTDTIRSYATKHGNASLKTSASDISSSADATT